jgi:hypothetical protein
MSEALVVSLGAFNLKIFILKLTIAKIRQKFTKNYFDSK